MISPDIQTVEPATNLDVELPQTPIFLPEEPMRLVDSLSRAERAQAISEGLLYESGRASRFRVLVDDLLILRANLGLLMWRAWLDTKARYRRSFLGPWWLTIGTLTFVVGYSVLAGFLFNRPLEEFLGYIACGVVIWQMITLMLTEGSKVFVANASEIKSVRTALLSYPVKLLIKGLISFLHSMPIVLLVVYFTDGLNMNTLMLFPGLLLLCLTMVPIAAMLGTLAARFRDIEQVVSMLMQFSFYMTPLLWKVELLGDGMGRWIALGNPFYYAITIIRNPLLGLPISNQVWIVTIAVTVFANIIGYAIFARFRQRLPYWI